MKRPDKIEIAVVIKRCAGSPRRWRAGAAAEAKTASGVYVRPEGYGEGASPDVAGKRAVEDACRRVSLAVKEAAARGSQS